MTAPPQPQPPSPPLPPPPTTTITPITATIRSLTVMKKKLREEYKDTGVVVTENASITAP